MSRTARERFANIVALLGANAFGRVLTLLYVMVVARALGLEAFGQLATVTEGPLGQTYGHAVRVLGLLALPLATGASVLAGPIIDLVYGAAYAAAAPVLAVLVWGLAVLFRDR